MMYIGQTTKMVTNKKEKLNKICVIFKTEPWTINEAKRLN